jgi:carboxyl-terminal processing protease
LIHLISLAHKKPFFKLFTGNLKTPIDKPILIKDFVEMTEKKSKFPIKIIAINLLVISNLACLLVISFLFYQRNQIAPETLEYRKLKGEISYLINRDGLGSLPDEDKQDKFQAAGLVQSLEDPYSEYLQKADSDKFSDSLNQRYQGIGVRFDVIENRIVVEKIFEGSPASQGGVQVGDQLLKVNQDEVDGVALPEVAAKIRGEEGTEVELIFKRGEELLIKKLTRQKIQTDLIYLTIKDSTAIIEITSFGENLDAKMKSVVEKIKSDSSIKNILIDIRGNSGGLLDEAVEVISYFVPENQTVLFEKEKNSEISIRSKLKDVNLQDYPVAILVDENSASASEILAGSLQDIREAKIVGRKTFGKGVVQRIYTLSNGDQLKLTIAEWLTPKKRQINKQGLSPDIEVKKGEDILKVGLQEIKK